MGLRVRRVNPSVAACVLAGLVVCAPGATAAPKAGAESPAMAEARRHFEVGLALLKEKNFNGGLSEFREAYALSKRHSALRNIAQCERELHQYAAAFRTLERLLAVHGADLKAPDRAATQRALEELRQLTAVVDVRITPIGADVAVDGLKVGVTPLERYRIDSGTRNIRVTKTGYDAIDRAVEVASMKDTTVTGELALEVTTGHLMVREATGAAVTVFVDGKSVGKAPFEGDLAPGSHVVEARGERVVAKPRSVEVAKRGRLEVTLETVPILGKLRVRATPADAVLRVNGGIAVVGAFEGELPIGQHTLVVEAPGFSRVERLLDITAGETIVQDVALAAIPVPVLPPREEPVRHEVPHEPVYDGLYSQLALHYVHGLTPFSAAACPKDANTYRCESGAAAGGGASLRVGYSFGVVGLEAAVLGDIDSRTDTRRIVTAPTVLPAEVDVDRAFLTTRGFVGGGLRILTPGTVRFTMGVAPGYALQSFSVTNTYKSGVSSRAGATGEHFAMLFDLGVTFGATPGTKFLIGATAMAEFVGEELRTGSSTYTDARKVDVVEPPYQVAPSMNWLLLPTVGFQFGH